MSGDYLGEASVLEQVVETCTCTLVVAGSEKESKAQ